MAYYVYQEDALENTASFQSKKSFITSTTVWSDLTDLKVFPIYQYLMICSNFDRIHFFICVGSNARNAPILKIFVLFSRAYSKAMGIHMWTGKGHEMVAGSSHV